MLSRSGIELAGPSAGIACLGVLLVGISLVNTVLAFIHEHLGHFVTLTLAGVGVVLLYFVFFIII
jgi:hypothetical protein